MLTTVQRVKDYLVGVGEAIPASHEPLLDFIERGISEDVQQFCQRRFATATYTAELHTGRAADTLLYFNQWPVTTITTVLLDGVAVTEGTESDNWIRHRDLEQNVLALYRENGWESDPYGISLTYVAGYILPGITGANLPADLERVVVELTATYYQQRGKSGLATESYEGLSQSFDRWPRPVLNTLWKYKRPVV